jgi:hypothetical protein
MRHPRQPHQRLVEVHVTIDEARQYKIAADIVSFTPASR